MPLSNPETGTIHPESPSGLDRLTAAGRLGSVARLLCTPRNVGWTLVTLSVVAGVQQYLLGPKRLGDGIYTHFNNYRIFARSFWHLARGQDLYVRFPAEHWDFYKYSPTFAALMAPFAALPDLAGLVLWNVLNAAVLLLALAKLPVLSPRSKALLGLVLAPDLLTAAQNSQSNVLAAGLVILAFDLLEEGRPGWAALPIACGFFVKIYPALGAILVLLYPRKLRFLAALAAWSAALAAVPLLLVSPGALRDLYASWLRLLLADRENLAGLSVWAWLHSWFGLEVSKTAVNVVGGVLLLLPLLNVKARAQPTFRLLFLASLLVWMVVFNHLAESATYVIAMCGVGLWWFAHPRRAPEAALFLLAILLTSMSPRFPGSVVDHVVKPYVLKAFPCILVWIAIGIELAWSAGLERARVLVGSIPGPRGA